MRRRAKVIIGLLLLYGILLGDNLTGYAAGNSQAGQPMYVENCQHCHGPDGKGNGEIAEYLDPPPADLTSARTQSRTDSEFLKIIREGRPGTKMYGYSEVFEDDELRDLIAFIRFLRK